MKRCGETLLLALFLIELAAGLYVFLPLAGRRNAGVKFYRLVLAISGVLTAGGVVAHTLAGAHRLALAGGGVLALAVVVWLVLRYPKRFVYRSSAAALGVAWITLGVASWHSAVRPVHPAWSVAGAISAMALLGSVTMAMTLGHWYLVVRGMAIDPLKRLTIATLVFSIAKLVVVATALAYAAREGTGYGTQFYAIAVGLGIFFWMRIGWGLAGPLFLYPMVWGTVKIRSTMAATGILYVDVVAVVIGEVIGGWLSSTQHLPL